MSSKKAELSAEDVESCINKMIAEPPFDAQFLAFLELEDRSTNPSFCTSMLSMFVTETTTTIDNLGEKLACCADGEMPPAASEELVELDRAAHTLKGSAMTMGIPSIVEPSMGLREGIAAALPSDIQRSLAELTAAWGRAKPVLVGLVSLMERRSELEAQVV